MLDLSALVQVLKQLREQYNYATDEDLLAQREGLDHALRLGTLHTFSTCYRLTIKTLRRFFALTHHSSEYTNQWTDTEVFEHAIRANLLFSEIQDWARFSELSTLDSLSYDNQKWEHDSVLILAFISVVQHAIEALAKSDFSQSAYAQQGEMHELLLQPNELSTLTAILKSLLPPDAQVYFFGSRANGRAHRGSDLDLAIDAGRKLTHRELMALEDAFHDSDLPYKVDVVDVQTLSPSFLAIISSHWQPISLSQ